MFTVSSPVMRDSYDLAGLEEPRKRHDLYIDVRESLDSDSKGLAETILVKCTDAEGNITWVIAMQKPIPISISTDTEGDDQ